MNFELWIMNFELTTRSFIQPEYYFISRQKKDKRRKDIKHNFASRLLKTISKQDIHVSNNMKHLIQIENENDNTLYENTSDMVLYV